ncbi:hypothetical protein ACJX0J_015138, partial [Zea mays]
NIKNKFSQEENNTRKVSGSLCSMKQLCATVSDKLKEKSEKRAFGMFSLFIFTIFIGGHYDLLALPFHWFRWEL